MYKTLFNLFAILNFTSAYNVMPSKFVQEAEIKHGRVAMVSSVAIPLLDLAKPDTLGVNFVNSLDNNVQLGLLAVVGCSEAAQLLKAYNFPENKSKWFTLKDNHTPGDYSFDPFNLNNKNNSQKAKNNELYIGRLAMIGVFCEMANELLFQEPILKAV